MKGRCSLCKAVSREPCIYEDRFVRVLKASKLKGHKNRVMVVTREHVKYVSPWLQDYMVDVLEKAGRRVFAKEYKFVIMSPINGTVTEHAHFVASDLDPEADDYDQVLATPWVRVVDTKYWDR